MHRTEGVILNSIDFRDYDRISTVFTQEEGLIKLIQKRANSAKYGKGAHAEPLTQAEFVYTMGRGELHVCREISILDSHLSLRKNLICLEAGCDLLKTLLATQLPHKPAPDLYKLLTGYLKNLPLAVDPFALATSFKLKVMRHDGTFGITPYCNSCQNDLEQIHVFGGESFCCNHKPVGSLWFNSEESGLLLELAYSRSYARLHELKVDGCFQTKIKHLTKN